MLDAAVRALSQMLSPPFRAILLKSVGLALVLIFAIGFGLHRLLVWLAGAGEVWAESVLGANCAYGAQHPGLDSLDRRRARHRRRLDLPDAGGDRAGGELLRRRHRARSGAAATIPTSRSARRCRLPVRCGSASRRRCLSILVYILAVPFLLFAGFGFVIFFVATAYLLSREYFELAAMRYRPPPEAQAMRKANQSTVFMAGLLIAAFVSIPIVNLATPLFGMALMVHVHKRLSRRQIAARSGY